MSKMNFSEAGKLGSIASAITNSLKKQKRIEAYNQNPKLCKFCSTPISYEKRRNDFCDQSCGASFNNKGIRRHGEAPIQCLNCKNQTLNEKFCSSKCQSDFTWFLKKEEIKNSNNETVAVETLKKYMLETQGHYCAICKLTEWLEQPISLVLDHIDGNAYNNMISNLRLICNNCDATLPTFKGRNKGNGRFKRAERYKREKEFFGEVKFKH